jgi:hypothetical protein
MPRYLAYAPPGGPLGQRANAVIGLFLGFQLGALLFTGHFVTPASLHLGGGGGGTEEAAAVPRPGGGQVDAAGLPVRVTPGSPWSIFAQGPRVAVTWAKDFLRALGLPGSGQRLRFVYDWEKSEGGGGRFNPLNQGPVPGRGDLTTTGQQYGGGAADYASWKAGMSGAVAYLHMGYYAGVLAGLRRGDYTAATHALWASPWAGSHYAWGARWNYSAVPRGP